MPKKEKVNYFDYFTEKEERNIQRSRKCFSKELEFWKESFNMLFDVFKSVANSYSEKWSDRKKASLFILPRLVLSAKVSLELLIRGYYFDHIVVNRSLVESLALFKLLSTDEEVAKKWLNFKRIELPKWKLMHRLLPTSPEKKMVKRLDRMYGEQSDFVHSSFVAIVSDWKRQFNLRTKYFEFLKFHKSIIREKLSAPSALLIVMYVIEVFREEIEESSKSKVMNLAKEKILEWKDKGLLKN